MSQKYQTFPQASERNRAGLPAGVIRMGYLRKLKKLKRRFFVLHMESNYGMARLEYYSSEKKWRLGSEPRRIVDLRSCLNINRRPHAKYTNVISFYTQFDCFSVVAETEQELQDWLTDLQSVQKYFAEHYTSRPIYDHLWQVVIDKYDLENDRMSLGPYRIALSQKSLFLINMTPLNDNDHFEFPLMSIRRCGHSKDHFFIELGRSSVVGAGEIYMATEGTYVAQNMHETVLGAMKVREDSRQRSASTSDNSNTNRHPSLPTSSLSASRERCDSLPTHSPYAPHSGSIRRLRPHSMYEWPSSNIPASPNLSENINNSPDTDTAHQITTRPPHPLSPPDDYMTLKEEIQRRPFFSLDRKKLNVKKDSSADMSSSMSAPIQVASSSTLRTSLQKSSSRNKLMLTTIEKPQLPAQPSNSNLEEVFYSSAERISNISSTSGVTEGEYVNIDLCRKPPVVPYDPNYSNVLFGKPSEFRKQLSAPLSPRPELPLSPGRKSSCPVTTTAQQQTQSQQPQQQLHLTPDHSSISSVSSASDEISSVHDSPKTTLDNQTYENVSLPTPNRAATLNYACLDLSPACNNLPESPTTPKATALTPIDSSIYAQIDFTKSEGLKSIVRDARTS